MPVVKKNPWDKIEVRMVLLKWMFKNISSKYSHENVKSSIFIASVLKTKMVKNAFFCYMKQIWNSIFQYHRKKEVLIPIDLKYTLL